MSAQHTQDTLIVLPPSVGVDANWHVTDKGDTFVAHVFGFGHAVDKQSEINARRIAACWNFCEGIETGQMEGNTFEEYVVNQAFINGMTPSDKGMNIDVSGLAAQLMAASFAGQFVGSGAINFLSMHMSHREIGEFVVTMQRKNGVSPAQKLKQAEAQRDELLEVLKHIRRCIPYGGFVQIHDNSMTLAQIDAAIAKAEGSAA